MKINKKAIKFLKSIKKEYEYIGRTRDNYAFVSKEKPVSLDLDERYDWIDDGDEELINEEIFDINLSFIKKTKCYKISDLLGDDVQC